MNRLDEFIAYLQYQRRLSKASINSYKNDILKFLIFLAKRNYKVEEVNPQIVRDFLTEEINNGISKRSCKRRICALKNFYNFLLQNDYVKLNPFSVINSPKFDRKLPSTLYKEQVEKILEINSKRTDFLAIRDQAILETLFYSGIRASELVNLVMQNLNIEKRIMKIIGKGSKERIVPFSKSCQAAIKKYLDELRPQLVKKSYVSDNEVFLNSQGKKLTVRGLEFLLKNIQNKCNIDAKLYPHLFRHTFATTLVEYGADIRKIQELLGHESINTTQIYTHISEKEINQIYQKFPRANKK